MDGRTTKMETHTRSVIISPGMSESTVMVIRREGNEQPGYEPTDLIIRLKAENNGNSSCPFTRLGDDLIYTHKMSLQDAIRCKPMRISTMDGKVIRIPVDEVLSPGSVKVFTGCGMPIENTNG